MTRHAIYLCALALTAVCSCTGHRSTTAIMNPEPALQPVAGSGAQAAFGADGPVGTTAPKAVAYRMSGDYAGNVPVTLAPDGAIISYPAPTDLTDRSEPLPLADGWWLDRRGISANSVFTRYTYPEYRALTAAPDPAQLKAAVIPGARVTAIVHLPMSVAEAVADTTAVNAALNRPAPRFVPIPSPGR